MDLARIRSGQRVVLTVEDQAQAEPGERRTVRNIVVEGDVDIGHDVDHESD